MEMNELDVLVPEPVSMLVGDEVIEIRPLTVGQIPAVVRAMKGVTLDFSDVLTLVDVHGDRLIEAVALCVGKPADWAAALPADEFVELARRVVEVNGDFFIRRVMPKISALLETVATGFGSSSGSSPTATG